MDLESAYNCGAELEACLPSTSRTEVKAAVQRHAASSFAAADVSELTAQLIEVREAGVHIQYSKLPVPAIGSNA